MTRFLTQAPGGVIEWVMSSVFLTPGEEGPQLKAGKSMKCLLDVYLCGSGWALAQARERAHRFNTWHSDQQFVVQMKKWIFCIPKAEVLHSCGVLVVQEVWPHSINLRIITLLPDWNRRVIGLFTRYLFLLDEELEEIKPLTPLQGDFSLVLTKWCASWKRII